MPDAADATTTAAGPAVSSGLRDTARSSRDHDIRNALNGIVVSLEALRVALAGPGSSSPQVVRFVDAASAQCQALMELLARRPKDPAPVAAASATAAP